MVLSGLKRAALVLAIATAVLLVVRVYDSERGPPLEPWHTFVPEELTEPQLDQASWDDYLEAEARLFERLRSEVTQKLGPDERVPYNRYFADSPIYPAKLARDWNRSYLLRPDGEPSGAVVLLHGLTDSPYSLRHIARRYRERGFLAIGIRLPAHGTVPGALTDVDWEDWLAATRLAVRTARAQTAPGAPLHLVGFSNGGALAVKYALDAIEDPGLARPDRIVLISPMIGITRFARFAGLAGLPAVLPAFAKAAWLGIIPEFNPFKYNSFPVNGARQSHRLTVALQQQVRRLAAQGRLAGLPPILTFQSVMDFTVSTPAVLSALYAHLPPNGSELVLFDINRSVKLGPLLRPSAELALQQLMPPLPQAYRLVVIANASDATTDTVERVVEPGTTRAQTRPLGLAYLPEIISLSHVAIPFPVDDSLYGLKPSPDDFYGAHLGTLTARGERGALIVSLDALFRTASNPFFPYLLERIDEGIRVPAPTVGAPEPGVVADGAVAPAPQETEADALTETLWPAVQDP